MRLRIAVYQLGNCSGCINEFLSAGETLLEMISRSDAELLSPIIFATRFENREMRYIPGRRGGAIGG